jgi:hypothetical protein
VLEPHQNPKPEKTTPTISFATYESTCPRYKKMSIKNSKEGIGDVFYGGEKKIWNHNLEFVS